MLSHFPTRAALVTSTGLVAVALVVAFPALRDMGPPPVVPLTSDDSEAPQVEPVVVDALLAPGAHVAPGSQVTGLVAGPDGQR
mgnify:CR=1 FL=1